MQHFTTFLVDFTMKRTKDSKENDTKRQYNQLPSSSEQSRKDRQQCWSPKDVAVHLLPARIFTTSERLALIIDIFSLTIFQIMNQSVTGIVLLESAEQDKSHQSHQEQDHHETVKDGKPMNRMLEEFVVQITIESGMKFLLCLHETNKQSKGELGTLLHLFKRLWITRQVHLDDLITVVAHNQIARGVDIRLKRGSIGIAQVTHVIEALQVVLFLLIHSTTRREHFTHHTPDRKVIEVHLIEPSMLNCLAKVSRIASSQWFGSTRFRLDSRIRGKGNIVARMTKRVTSETFSERMNLQFVPLSSFLGFWVVLCFRGTIGESVILIGFLGVGIGTDLVHPKLYMFTRLILMI
mmetsp:Transcript_30012/g.49570  ORF Transcript_30012/g.49570 Transcript_30012/m.49570 type:complete len:351 (-) Transcript_30012:66-1118(-)